MKLVKPSIKKTAFVAGVVAITFGIISLAGYFFVANGNKEKNELTKNLADANKKIIELTNEIGSAKVEAETARKELKEIQAEYEKTDGKTEAFAKQAAACESIKKQLRVKN
jgi:peptidoglycan hydrolase CwlO-like protein